MPARVEFPNRSPFEPQTQDAAMKSLVAIAATAALALMSTMP